MPYIVGKVGRYITAVNTFLVRYLRIKMSKPKIWLVCQFFADLLLLYSHSVIYCVLQRVV